LPLAFGLISPTQRMRDIVEEIELADQLGLDVPGLGEHHRTDFIRSAPAVALAAGAFRSKRIRLTSAVSVLSSDHPVRVYPDIATLDLLSAGRAEIMAGRGSFIESFPSSGTTWTTTMSSSKRRSPRAFSEAGSRFPDPSRVSETSTKRSALRPEATVSSLLLYRTRFWR
jgi:alkanesulfonate monooxygenase SsuD/methylene tetrahydromethanopterin reductase-like flavin-dependent oxidoreductase (luciferase family)